ncbi:hypothetical protein AB0I95_10910 [Micromonospora sp. NPDC049751]|uniref:hypothetical protein n=1 Tax=Micromonospora sp. NPDC049751 TaxID=3154837 RepID=UPI0033D3EF2E
MSVDLEAVAHLASRDRRAARKVLAAQHARAAEEARIAAADAAMQRQLQAAERQQQLTAQTRVAQRREAEEIAAHRRARREARARVARQRAARLRHRSASLVGYVRGHADDVYAAAMYLLAVGGAVYGQITAALGRGWPLLAGIVVAVAIEGLALVMALTAQKMRLAGEAARAPRALTWLCAGTAAAINYLGHSHASRIGAGLLAILSVAGIVVWEIRSGARHRVELRRRQLLPDPPAAFGWRRWLRFLPSTAAAWSVDVRDRVSPRAAYLLRQAAAERQDQRTAARLNQVRRLARRSVRAAARRGDTGAVLAQLTWLAEHGTSRPVPALPNSQIHRETGLVPDQSSPPQQSATPPQDRTWPSPDPTASTEPDPKFPSGQELPAQDRTGPAPHLASPTGPNPASRSARAAPAQDQTSVDWDHGKQDQGHGLQDQVHAERPAQRNAGPSSGPRINHPASAIEKDNGIGVRRVDGSGPGPRERPSAGFNPTQPTTPSTRREGTGRPRPRPTLDVTDLMDPGRQVADRLAAHGVALSRSVLIKGLRADGIRVSTDRATALLAALRADGPMEDPAVLPTPQN